MVPSIDRLLADDYLDGLGGWPVGELRRRRHQCQEVETGLSYFRRLVQGRHDIVLAEVARRRGGVAAPDLEGLIEQLPGILGEPRRSGSDRGQLSEVGPPPDTAELEAQLDGIVDAERLASLPELADDQLAAVVDRLTELERSVSSQRHSLHERIDVLQAEIVKRYKSGEATVDALLR